MSSYSVHSEKMPGDLVFGINGEIFRIDDRGSARPYESPHRRLQRERAEAFRERMTPAQPPRSIAARAFDLLFGRA